MQPSYLPGTLGPVKSTNHDVTSSKTYKHTVTKVRYRGIETHYVVTSSPLLLSLALINPAVFRSGSALVTFKPPMALRSFRNPNPVSSLLKYPVLPCSTPRLLSSNRLRFPIQTAAFRTTTTAKMSLDEWKHRAPYKIHENDANFKVRYEGGCHCGRVRYQLSREKPLDAKYCHCTTCQKLHGTFL